MAIQPVKPGGWGPNDTPRNTELTEIDSKLAARGLDTSGTDTVPGTISITAGLWTTATGQVINVTGAGALAQLTGAADITYGDNDYRTFSATRSRTVHISMLEADFGFSTDTWAIDSSNLTGSGVNTYGLQNKGSGGAAIDLPITRPHDGATITQVVAYFLVPKGVLSAAWPGPGAGPALLLGRCALATGAITTIASATFTVPGSASAYFNNGVPNTITVNPVANNVVDLTQYSYFAQLIDDTNAVVANHIVFTGIKVVYSSIADARFPQ